MYFFKVFLLLYGIINISSLYCSTNNALSLKNAISFFNSVTLTSENLTSPLVVTCTNKIIDKIAIPLLLKFQKRKKQKDIAKENQIDNSNDQKSMSSEEDMSDQNGLDDENNQKNNIVDPTIPYNMIYQSTKTFLLSTICCLTKQEHIIPSLLYNLTKNHYVDPENQIIKEIAITYNISLSYIFFQKYISSLNTNIRSNSLKNIYFFGKLSYKTNFGYILAIVFNMTNNQTAKKLSPRLQAQGTGLYLLDLYLYPCMHFLFNNYYMEKTASNKEYVVKNFLLFCAYQGINCLLNTLYFFTVCQFNTTDKIKTFEAIVLSDAILLDLLVKFLVPIFLLKPLCTPMMEILQTLIPSIDPEDVKLAESCLSAFSSYILKPLFWHLLLKQKVSETSMPWHMEDMSSDYRK